MTFRSACTFMALLPGPRFGHSYGGEGAVEVGEALTEASRSN
jgi:hypothetical protein